MNTPRIVEMLTKGTQLKNFKCEKFSSQYTSKIIYILKAVLEIN